MKVYPPSTAHGEAGGSDGVGGGATPGGNGGGESGGGGENGQNCGHGGDDPGGHGQVPPHIGAPIHDQHPENDQQVQYCPGAHVCPPQSEHVFGTPQHSTLAILLKLRRMTSQTLQGAPPGCDRPRMLPLASCTPSLIVHRSSARSSPIDLKARPAVVKKTPFESRKPTIVKVKYVWVMPTIVSGKKEPTIRPRMASAPAIVCMSAPWRGWLGVGHGVCPAQSFAQGHVRIVRRNTNCAQKEAKHRGFLPVDGLCVVGDTLHRVGEEGAHDQPRTARAPRASAFERALPTAQRRGRGEGGRLGVGQSYARGPMASVATPAPDESS